MAVNLHCIKKIAQKSKSAFDRFKNDVTSVNPTPTNFFLCVLLHFIQSQEVSKVKNVV